MYWFQHSDAQTTGPDSCLQNLPLLCQMLKSNHLYQNFDVKWQNTCIVDYDQSFWSPKHVDIDPYKYAV